jgi:PDZ domain-containing secreted protein
VSEQVPGSTPVDDAPAAAEPEASGAPGTVWGMSRRAWMLTASGVTLLVLLAVAFLLPVPYVKLGPGPTFNVAGEADGKPVISITGTQTYPVDGALDMTTVLESGGPRGGLTFATAIAAWFNPADAVVPRELLFPDDVTGEQVQTRQAMLFSTSESNAVAAAMDYLGKPVTTDIVVTAVYSDSPSDGVLEPRDTIVTVDGADVTDPASVATTIRSKPIGTTFSLGIERDGSPMTVSVTSAANPDDASVPYIGIGVGPLYSADFPIDFTLEDVGGPSAGLMFAVGIVAKLSPQDLTAGHHIAGTGTIDPDGTVGPIGGIRQKLAGARNAGATLFLMPKDHCAEAAGHIPDGLTVVPVTTLTEAVTAIKGYDAGATLPTCPAPSAS